VGALNDAISPEEPAEGYFLDVRFKGVERSNANEERPSTNVIEYSAAPGAGNRVKYNYKYEYRPPGRADAGARRGGDAAPVRSARPGYVAGLGARRRRQSVVRRGRVLHRLQQSEP
jgi:hypothetical protein